MRSTALVRLACLIHAASVHPGPGSNPQSNPSKDGYRIESEQLEIYNRKLLDDSLSRALSRDSKNKNLLLELVENYSYYYIPVFYLLVWFLRNLIINVRSRQPFLAPNLPSDKTTTTQISHQETYVGVVLRNLTTLVSKHATRPTGSYILFVSWGASSCLLRMPATALIWV